MSSRYAILGTAGHIDHGKTTLVGLLTGTDTDRLKEEKARGISIDLGFAHLDLPGGISCGVVDVPGHERFVKNMLAGACGVDAMLLVIAADEGVMPQTREHLDILDLLGVERGVVALTKTDMVDPDWLELVTESVGEYLAERGFGAFPVVPVSSKTGAGKGAVLAALSTALSDLPERPPGSGVRLPVDRAFVVEGFGSVITGTLWRGELRPGDRLIIEPGAVATRARKVEVHGREVETALAGQRTAVAVAGVSREQVPRGSWALTPGTLTPAHMLDVRLRMLRDAPKELRHRQRVRFHLGASEILGRVSLLEGEVLRPGETALAQIGLEGPVVADRRDRFVLRSYSPARAIAGGTVILPTSPRKRRRGHADLDALRREESGSATDRVAAALAAAESGAAAGELAGAAGLDMGIVLAELETLAGDRRAVRVAEDHWAAPQVLEGWSGRVLELLQAAQAQSVLRWGMGRGELKSRLGSRFPAAVFDYLLGELSAAGRVTLQEDQVRYGDGEHALPADVQAQVDRVAEALAAGGVAPPNTKELEASLGFPVLEVLEHLTFRGEAVKVSPELFLNRLSFTELTAWLEKFFQKDDELSVAELRETWGMSRKYSVPILEYLDKQGWTRRVGDVRAPGRRFDD